MCGIAGIISKTQRAFDYSAFCSLGIINDRRGGDSCGVFIDGNVEYGVGKEKLFEDFFLGSDLLTNTTRSTIALLHCRKASVGLINKDTAQPIVLRDTKGKVEYVVIHNGTIFNYKELADKYIPDVDIKGLTDSQVMARIFYYKGYDVLNEYNGGSVFAIVDYRGASPKTLFFKGASKEYKYSKDIYEERPLFYCINKNKREIVFSSIASQLMAVRRDDDAYIMPHNQLVEFNGKDLVLVKNYPRTDCTQKKEFATTTSYKSSYSKYYEEDYAFESDFYRNFLTIDLEKNLYSIRGKKCHGKFFLGKYGYVHSKADNKIPTYEVYFFLGIPLLDANSFRFLSVLKKESNLSDEEFFTKFEITIRFLSLDGVFHRGGLWYKAVSPTNCILFTGLYQPITAQSVSSYSSGKKISSYYSTSAENIERKLAQKRELNFKAIKEQCKSLMK